MVSVIIPMYNAEKYISECLKSVISQDYTDIEIIVIDDGSMDSSLSIVLEQQRKDGRIKLIKQDNHGLVYSRKQGILKAAGEYILFVDSDDWLELDMISSLGRIAEDDKADVVASAATICIEGSRCLACNAASEGLYQDDELKELKKKLFCFEDYSTMALLPFLWNKLWRKELIEKYVLAAEDKMTIAEDVAIGFPAILDARRLTVTNKSFYNYRKTASSMLNKKKDALREVENVFLINKTITRACSELLQEPCSPCGLDRFLINQLFTRAYSFVQSTAKSQGLFPYCDEMPQNLVLYGAGELGRELYDYAHDKTNIRYWVDKEADTLRAFGLSVCSIDQCEAHADDVVVVAVFSKRATKVIVKDLLNKGYKNEQILTFNLSKALACDLIRKAIGD